MSSVMTAPRESPASEAPENYLTKETGLRTWLLTTDHKRIALLYMATITVFFFVGGFAAFLMRLNLVTPQGAIMSHESYNRTFTLHGVVMVWFFLVPAVPVTIGNFVLPLVLGARDLAFPRLNLHELVPVRHRRRADRVGAADGRARHRLDVLHAAHDQLHRRPRGAGGDRDLRIRVQLDCDRAQLHRHHPPAAGARHGLVSHAGHLLVALCDVGDLRARHPCAGDHADPAGVRAPVPCRRVRPATRRRPAAVPAHVLVLQPSGRLHHDPAGVRCRQRDRADVLPEAVVRLQVRRLGQHFDCRHQLLRLGPPHVRGRAVGVSPPSCSAC